MTTTTPTLADRLADMRQQPGITPLTEAKEALRNLVAELTPDGDARPSELDALARESDRLTDVVFSAALRELEEGRVTVDRLDREAWAQDEIDEGQGLDMAATGFTSRQFRDLPDGHPAPLAWEAVVNEVLSDLGPQIRDLVCDALERRLPWTWKPER